MVTNSDRAEPENQVDSFELFMFVNNNPGLLTSQIALAFYKDYYLIRRRLQNLRNQEILASTKLETKTIGQMGTLIEDRWYVKSGTETIGLAPERYQEQLLEALTLVIEKGKLKPELVQRLKTIVEELKNKKKEE